MHKYEKKPWQLGKSVTMSIVGNAALPTPIFFS